MTRWQYGVIDTTAPGTVDALNGWGAEGWECFHIERDWGASALQTQKPIHCFMKRPIPESEDEQRWGTGR